MLSDDVKFEVWILADLNKHSFHRTIMLGLNITCVVVIIFVRHHDHLMSTACIILKCLKCKIVLITGPSNHLVTSPPKY